MTLADTLFPKEDAKSQPQGLHKTAEASLDKAPAAAFSWPPPPFATYQSPEPWREPQECDIEGLNGAIRRCRAGLELRTAPSSAPGSATTSKPLSWVVN